MNVLMLGASGQIGDFLLPKLLERGFAVSAISRTARAPASGLRWIKQDAYAAPPLLHACDALVSAGPLDALPALIAGLARGAGLRRVVAFGSMSAEAKKKSPCALEREQAEHLAKLEDNVFSAAAAHGVCALILRPTLIYGCGRDLNVSRLRRLARHTRLVLLPRSAIGLRQPVHAQDLAMAALTALTTGCSGTLALAGAEALAYDEMVARVISTIPGWVGLVRMPDVWFRSVMRPFGALELGQIERLGSDQCVDLAPARLALNFSARPFAPTVQDFEPAHCLRARSGSTLQPS